MHMHRDHDLVIDIQLVRPNGCAHTKNSSVRSMNESTIEWMACQAVAYTRAINNSG